MHFTVRYVAVNRVAVDTLKANFKRSRRDAEHIGKLRNCYMLVKVSKQIFFASFAAVTCEREKYRLSSLSPCIQDRSKTKEVQAP